MNTNDFIHRISRVIWPSMGATSLMVLILLFSIYLYHNPTVRLVEAPPNVKSVLLEKNEPQIIEGVHIATGLKDGDGLQLVIKNCTNCHSSKLIIQNRMSADSWRQTISWMQRTQNLWDLGENEALIVNYLATNYAPNKKGRRQNIEGIEWYRLELD